MVREGCVAEVANEIKGMVTLLLFLRYFALKNTPKLSMPSLVLDKGGRVPLWLKRLY